MGWHYETCENCGMTFPDAWEEAVYCNGCDTAWCGKKCSDTHHYREDEDGEGMCDFCEGKAVTDSWLLGWLLKRAGWTREQAVNESQKEE
jgi:hypothetical protein